jgi:hypothetical protein
MLRTKTMFLTVVVVALAVPSLWAQKERLVRPKAAPDGSAVCVVTGTGTPPVGYYASTNKCSSGNANYGNGNSQQAFVAHCSDSGGVEATYDKALNVQGVGRGNTWPAPWQNGFEVGSSENAQPDVYSQAISIANTISLKLSHLQGVLGLEFNNLTLQTYIVTFHTTVGDIKSVPILAGGTTPDTGFAQRSVAVCSGPAITGVTVSCAPQDGGSCTETSGDGSSAIAQIRGDKFKGF